MEIDQAALIEKSKQIISPFSLIKTLMMIVIYIGVVVAFFLIMKMELDPYVIGMIVVILAAYFISKDYLLARQTGSLIRTHKAFIDAKHNGNLLYIPLLGRSGSLFHLKQAALFIKNDCLYIEVFESRSLKQGPLNGVTVPQGDDFRICSEQSEQKRPIRNYKTKIKGQDFSFYVVDDPLLNTYLAQGIKPIEKEVA